MIIIVMKDGTSFRFRDEATAWRFAEANADLIDF